jgi:murein DD-endopeptidase MepM/ murein hydrolase activator NlpD
VKRRLALGLGILLVLIPLLFVAAPGQLAADEITDKQRELQELDAQKQQQEQDLQVKRQERDSLTTGLLAIDKALYAALEKQRAAELKLEQVTIEVAELTRQTDTTEHTLKQHQSDLERRIVAIYKEGEMNTLEMLLSTDNFSDFLGKADALESVAGRDQELVERVQQDQAMLGAQKDQLQEREQQSKELKAEIEKQKVEVEAQLDAQQSLLDSTKEDERAMTAEMQEMDQQAAELTATIQRLEDEKKARELAARLARERAERERLAGVAAARRSAISRTPEARVSSSGFAWPAQGYISCRFGGRTPYQSFHTGLDIATGGTGAPIVAALDGVVIQAGYSVPGNRRSGYGMMVIIAHGDGLSTLYAHMDDNTSPVVSEGQVVQRGQVLGYVGMTGYTTGPHLHFEVRVNGAPQNPEAYLQ